MSNKLSGPAFGPGYGDEVTWPPPAGHPNDPRTEPAEFSDLTEAEKRAELNTLERTELVDMVLSLAESVVEWENRAARIAAILGVK